MGEQLKIELIATDPENQTVKFHLKQNYEGVALSESGLLKWTPKKLGVSLLTVVARDRCGKESSSVLEVNVTQCSCGERETCSLVRNLTGEFIICRCPDGCTGPM